VKKKILAVIPARGGSVRVPKKNILPLNGKPVIAYAIDAAFKSNFVDKVVVSSDSDEIISIASAYGAECPFVRPKDLAEDVPTEDVIIHALTWLEKNEKYIPDVVVCLECDKPFRQSHHLDACISRLLETEENQYDSSITVHKIKSGRPEWYLRIKNERCEPYVNYFQNQGEAILRFPASQIFEDIYIPNGVVFASRLSTIKKYGSLVGKNCYPHIIDQSESISINYPDDLDKIEKILAKI